MSKVKLNWASSSAQLLESLKEIWASDGFSNITLTFEDESEIFTNRILLAALSPVMRNFLQGKESQNSKIFMFGIDSSTMKSLIDFIYTEEICIEQEKLDMLLSTASKLKVNGFMEAMKDMPAENTGHDTLNDPQHEPKQELCTTLNEIPPFNVDLADFETFEVQDVNVQNIESEHGDPHQEVQTQRGSTKLKIDDEKNNRKGISCFICKAAGKVDHDRFPSMNELHQHEKEDHTTDKSPVYSCEHCGLEFRRLILFNQHKRKEHPVNPTRDSVSCDVCGRSYKTVAKMEKHREYSHPTPGILFKCKMPGCPKESMTKNASNVHYYQAHPERQRKEFEGKL